MRTEHPFVRGVAWRSAGGRIRSWTSWHRWTVLALLACAFLSVLAATQPDDGHPRDDQLIPLTPDP
jgi:hypothetical protein